MENGGVLYSVCSAFIRKYKKKIDNSIAGERIVFINPILPHLILPFQFYELNWSIGALT